MHYKVEYLKVVFKDDTPALDANVFKRLKDAIEAKLETSPNVFGKPLQLSLKGYRSLRVGDYRIVFRIEPRIVLVVAMRHRRDVYIVARKRLG